jgi:threonine aldolase
MQVSGTSVAVENHQSRSWQYVDLITFGVTYKNCHKRGAVLWQSRSCVSSFGYYYSPVTKKFGFLGAEAADAIQIKIHRYIKPNSTDDGIGYGNSQRAKPRLPRDCYI